MAGLFWGFWHGLFGSDRDEVSVAGSWKALAASQAKIIQTQSELIRDLQERKSTNWADIAAEVVKMNPQQFQGILSLVPQLLGGIKGGSETLK